MARQITASRSVVAVVVAVNSYGHALPPSNDT
jgi:hypothetical protein